MSFLEVDQGNPMANMDDFAFLVISYKIKWIPNSKEYGLRENYEEEEFFITIRFYPSSVPCFWDIVTSIVTNFCRKCDKGTHGQ